LLFGALITTAATTETVRAILAGPVVIGALMATVTTPAAADDSRGLRVLSVDRSQPSSPSIVVGVPGELAGEVLSSAAFVALDDNGPLPIRVEHLGVDQLDVVLVLDTAGDVPLETVGRQQGAAFELLRHLQDAGRVGIYTSTARALQSPTSDRQSNYSLLFELEPKGDREFARGVLSALARFHQDRGSRRAIIVMSAGAGNWTTRAETTALAEDLTALDAQVFWLAVEGTTPPPIVRDLGASGQPVTLIRGNTATMAADRVATELDAQYRMTIDVTGAVGPVRLRVEGSGAVDEVPLAVEGTSGVPQDGGGTSATWRALAFFVAVATVMTLTVVIASTSAAVVHRTRRVGRT
jgi:hypothetical protein